ncbi:MAG TPA: agmatinase [Thermoplasmatales archaeon]|nr:agmatinase [Thermoplasmatales archaeon]
MIFADADENYREADFVILGIPFEDSEMSFREGTSKAPDFIRYYSHNYESYVMESGIDLQNIKIHDAGNFSIEEAKNFVRRAREENKIPIVIGGAHSISPFLISSINEDLNVVILDAHLDFRKDYMGNEFSHACASRRIFEEVGKNRMISIGIRSASREEVEEAEKLNFKYILSSKFKKNIADEIKFDKIYLSIDMDVFDPCYAPGVSNPEPNGLGYEIFEFIKKISKKIYAVDVVEVSPPYDDGRTSLLAAKVIRNFISWKI